ncbi:MAG: hypothetical protein V3T57_05265 [Kiloniellales bacterium]
MHFARQHERYTPVEGVAVVIRPGAADGAGADLDDPFHPRHLGSPAHRARQAETLARHLVAPIDVGIDLHYGERPAAFISLDDRDGYGIISSERDRPGAAFEDRFDRGADPLPVAGCVVLVVRQIATVDHARPGCAEQRPAEVEVLVIANPGVTGDPGADRRRCARAIGADGLVRRGAWRPDNGDVSRQLAQLRTGGKAQEGLIAVAGAEHPADVR